MAGKDAPQGFNYVAAVLPDMNASTPRQRLASRSTRLRGLLCFLRPRFLRLPGGSGGGGLARSPAFMILRYSAANRLRSGPYSRVRPSSTALATAPLISSSNSISSWVHSCPYCSCMKIQSRR